MLDGTKKTQQITFQGLSFSSTFFNWVLLSAGDKVNQYLNIEVSARFPDSKADLFLGTRKIGECI